MAHPIMFDEADPLLARVREVALALPGASEKVSHGRPAFLTTKLFGFYGGSVKVDGAWVAHDACVMVKASDEERPALVADPRCFVPAYLGPGGWVGLDLDDDTDWGEVAELLEESYRLTAGPRLIARLDAP